MRPVVKRGVTGTSTAAVASGIGFGDLETAAHRPARDDDGAVDVQLRPNPGRELHQHQPEPEQHQAQDPEDEQLSISGERTDHHRDHTERQHAAAGRRQVVQEPDHPAERARDAGKFEIGHAQPRRAGGGTARSSSSTT